jgi:hypothetical protein
MKEAYNFRSVSIDNGIYRRDATLSGLFCVAEGILQRMGVRLNAEPKFRSILVIFVVVSLISRAMRLVALIVPEPSIHAVGCQQLRVRTALDRLAA